MRKERKNYGNEKLFIEALQVALHERGYQTTLSERKDRTIIGSVVIDYYNGRIEVKGDIEAVLYTKAIKDFAIDGNLLFISLESKAGLPLPFITVNLDLKCDA